MNMGIIDLLAAISKQQKSGYGYQIHVNNADLNNNDIGVELSDLLYTDCSMIRNTDILVFDNRSKKPISKKEDGTPLYSAYTDNELYLNIAQIEQITAIEDITDWFNFPVTQVIDIKLKSNSSVTIGFLE